MSTKQQTESSKMGSSSSSSEEDGEAEWKAAIQSIVSTTTFSITASNGENSASLAPLASIEGDDGDDQLQPKPQKLKYYQIKAQKLLDDFIEKTLAIEKDVAVIQDNYLPEDRYGAVQLFRNAPPGIVFDNTEELQGPSKKPKILPGIGIDKKSKKFKKLLRTIAMDGEDILAAARESNRRSLTALEAKDAAAKLKAKLEAERIVELKRVRGERWLPSVAREIDRG